MWIQTLLSACVILSAGTNIILIQYPLLHSWAILKRAHASFIDVALTKIRLHLIEALNYSESDEAALLLMKFYDDYVSEVKHHMEYENNVIFSYVERLQCNEIDEEFKIDMYSVNHDSMTAKLNELKDIFIYHYKQKENSRLSAVLL